MRALQKLTVGSVISRALLLLVVLLVPHGSGRAQTSNSLVSTSFSGLILNRVTNTFNSILTVTNKGPTVYAPLKVYISTGTSSVTVANAATNGPGSFALVVPLSNGSLLPNEAQSLLVAFNNPSRVPFTPSAGTTAVGASTPAGLGIAVTSPVAGQAPAGPTFPVIGTITAAGVAGASIDGVGACLYGTTFFVNAFQPTLSPSRFTATASDIDGGNKSISVDIVSSSKGLRISSSAACGGVVPLTDTVSVALDTTDGDAIASGTIDFGDGGGPVTLASGGTVQHVYANPGLYTITGKALTVLGARLMQTALVAVQTPADAFAPILRNVALLKAALSAKNISRALSYLTSTAQTRYAPALSQAGINLPGIARLLGTAQPYVLLGNYSEVVITANTPSGARSSSIVLQPDFTGVWRIDSW